MTATIEGNPDEGPIRAIPTVTIDTVSAIPTPTMVVVVDFNERNVTGIVLTEETKEQWIEQLTDPEVQAYAQEYISVFYPRPASDPNEIAADVLRQWSLDDDSRAVVSDPITLPADQLADMLSDAAQRAYRVT